MHEFAADHHVEIQGRPEIDPDAAIPAVVIGPAPAHRSRLSRLLLLGLVLSVAVLVGAGFISRRLDTDRRAAVDRHTAAAADLATQTARSSASDSSLAAATQAAATFHAADAALLVIAQQATALTDQEVALAEQAQAAGLAGSTKDWNAAIDRGNALIAQDDALATQLSDGLDALPGAHP